MRSSRCASWQALAAGSSPRLVGTQLGTRHSRNETLWNVPWLLQLDPRELHHLGPFLGFVGDEFPEFSGGHKCRLEAHVEEAHLHLRIGNDCVDLVVEPAYHIGRSSIRAPRSIASPHPSPGHTVLH